MAGVEPAASGVVVLCAANYTSPSFVASALPLCYIPVFSPPERGDVTEGDREVVAPDCRGKGRGGAELNHPGGQGICWVCVICKEARVPVKKW